MATLNELKAWIDRDCRARRWRVELATVAERSLCCQITAERYVFTVTAEVDDDYLGCTCRTRFSAPGENHYRFADLPDGRLVAETWESILAHMKQMEIRPFRGRAL